MTLVHQARRFRLVLLAVVTAATIAAGFVDAPSAASLSGGCCGGSGCYGHFPEYLCNSDDECGDPDILDCCWNCSE